MIDDGDKEVAWQVRDQSAIDGLCYKQRDEGRSEEPGQHLDTTRNAHLITQRSQHVIAGEQREKISERPECRGALVWSRRYRPLDPSPQGGHGASESFCLSSAAVASWPYPGPPRWK